jgi:glycosyltransferase involved in cell wall biosynthesis
MSSPTRTHAPRVSVVIPALNEAENLPWVLQRLPPLVDEVILVDGGSSDGTADIARSILPGVRIIDQYAPGKGAALAAGLCAARGDIAVMIDADCSMDPREIPAFVGALVAGADLVKGSRYVAGAGSRDLTPLRNLGNRGLSRVANLLFGGHWSELCYGYAAMWVDILDPLGIAEVAFGDGSDISPAAEEVGGDTSPPKCRPRAYGHGFEIEALLFCRAARNRLRVVEVASYELERQFGESNLLTFRDGLRVLGAVLKERRRPVAAATALAGVAA